jgi:hypothetical protein
MTNAAAAVWLVGANAFKEFLVVHPEDSNVTVIGCRDELGAGDIPRNFPNRAVIVVELSRLSNFEPSSTRVLDYWLQIKNADIF